MKMFLVTAFSILGILSTPRGADPTHMCTIVSMAWVRAPAAMLFIVTPLPDTISAGHWIERPFTFTPKPTDSADTVAVYGQLLSVDTILGPDSARITDAFERLGRRVIVVVPWHIGSACERHPWGREAPLYLSPGTPTFVATALRPEDQWVDGIPTFDSDSIADLYDPAHLAAQWHQTDPTRPFIPVRDYLAFYQVLPDWKTWRRDPPGESRRLRSWVRARKLTRQPIVDLFSAMDQWLRDWRQGYWRDSL